jgi:hypothetical protein
MKVYFLPICTFWKGLRRYIKGEEQEDSAGEEAPLASHRSDPATCTNNADRMFTVLEL